jgi:hypothetical protein
MGKISGYTALATLNTDDLLDVSEKVSSGPDVWATKSITGTVLGNFIQTFAQNLATDNLTQDAEARSYDTNSQNIRFYNATGFGINTSAVNEATALLQMDSTSKGFLPPRMSTAQRTGISTPAEGLVVHDTDENKLYFYNGTAWIALAGNIGNNNQTVSAARTVTMNGFDITFTGSNQNVVIDTSGYIYSNGKGGLADTTVYGEGAGAALTTGDYNALFGYFTGDEITSGSYNSGFGWSCLGEIKTTNDNSAFGYRTLTNAQGAFNTGMGSNCLSSLGATGDNNTMIGGSAGNPWTSGDNNTGLGKDAGRYRATGGNATSSDDSVFIGYNSRPLGSGNTNQICVGANTYGKGSNTASWGASTITEHYFHGSLVIEDGITAPSSTSGYAKLYIDTSDGDLKIIFGDGTVKTIVVDT